MRHAVWPYDGDFIDDDEPDPDKTMTRQQILDKYGEWLFNYLVSFAYLLPPRVVLTSGDSVEEWTDAEVHRALELARRDAYEVWGGDAE